MVGVITSLWRRTTRKIGTVPVILGLVVVVGLLRAGSKDGTFGGIVEFRSDEEAPSKHHHNVVHRHNQKRKEVHEKRSKRHKQEDAEEVVAVPIEEEPEEDKKRIALEIGLAEHAGVEIFSTKNCQGEPVKFDSTRSENKCVRCFDTCRGAFADDSPMLNGVKSYRVKFAKTGRGGRMPPAWSVSTYQVCAGSFGYSEQALNDANILRDLRPESGCVEVSPGKEPNMFRFDGMAHPDDVYTPQSYHVVYSAESSGYFGFQAYANLYAFQNSNQQTDPPVGYTRLLTAQGYDDLSTEKGGVIPTFAQPRDPYSWSYSPYNKAHALTAFMNDPVKAPKEEVIIIIDPDNWLVNNLGPIAAKVKPGRGVAAAAFYDGNPMVTDLFQKHICTQACDFIPDTVAVPYFVHRDDAKKIAPLYAALTKKVKKIFDNPVHAKTYDSLQPGWCAEMYGYIFAAAELRIKHDIVPGLQIRDVDGTISAVEAAERRIRMIHMGRAWFPTKYAHEVAPQWIHTEGHSLRKPQTEQVWCKCNVTAADVFPWPLPPQIDFVSNITLTYMHESQKKWGHPPTNEYRKSYHARWE